MLEIFNILITSSLCMVRCRKVCWWFYLSIILRLFEVVGEDFLEPGLGVPALVEAEELRLGQDRVLPAQFPPHLGESFVLSLFLVDLQLVTGRRDKDIRIR